MTLRHNIVCKTAVIFLACFAATHTAYGETANEMDPSKHKARLLAVRAGYALWLTSDLHVKTSGNVAQTSTWAFYRQQLDQQKSELIYQYSDTAQLVIATLGDDGSLLMETRNDLYFVPKAGPPMHQKLEWLNCLEVYPDGILAQDTHEVAFDDFRPIYFIPFDANRLNFKNRILVAPSGVMKSSGRSGLYCSAQLYRRGDLFLWVDGSTLITFNLKDGKHSELKLSCQTDVHSKVTSFDGSTVLCGAYAFDANTGKLVGEQEYLKRPINVSLVFAVHNRIGYYFDTSGGLWATDLNDRGGARRRIANIEPGMAAETDGGFAEWDDSHWAEIPWLKTFQQP